MNEENEQSDKVVKKSSRHGKKRVVLFVFIIIAVVLVIVGGLSYVHWYKMQDHSVYGKLSVASYNKSGTVFSFGYPSVMENSPTIASKIPNAPLAYTYYINSNLQAVIAASHENIASTLHALGLKPAQFIGQLKSGQGNFVTALDGMQGSANAFKEDFPGCDHSLTTNSKQNTVLCVHNTDGHTYVRVIGATSGDQYTLEMIMLPSVWANHQKAWQKIEKSFSFQ